MSYASNHVALQMFEKKLEALRSELMAAVEEMIQPLLDEGRKAMEDFVAAEAKLKDERFSEN